MVRYCIIFVLTILIFETVIHEKLVAHSYNIASPHAINIVRFRRRTFRIRLDGIYNPIFLVALYKIVKYIANHSEDFSLYNIEVGRRVVMDRVSRLINIDEDDEDEKDRDKYNYQSNYDNYGDGSDYGDYSSEDRSLKNGDVIDWLNSYNEAL